MVAEHRLGIVVVTGNIHDNNFIPIESVSDAVVGVDCPVLAPLKKSPSETFKGLLVL